MEFENRVALTPKGDSQHGEYYSLTPVCSARNGICPSGADGVCESCFFAWRFKNPLADISDFGRK